LGNKARKLLRTRVSLDLHRNSVFNTQTLAGWTPLEVLKLAGIGTEELEEIRQDLKAQGLKLRDPREEVEQALKDLTEGNTEKAQARLKELLKHDW